MIYITGDCHGDFSRFTRKQRLRLPFRLTENDYVIVCGDFGLLWAEDREFEYNCDWLSRLPFTLLWVQGNHENYDMISNYPMEEWNGGLVRHIIHDKVILLERGQVFKIENKTFFTMGGASSHDVQGGILDMSDPAYNYLRNEAIKTGLSYRVIGKTYWFEELPSQKELDEGLKNLEKVDYKVDYVISHCTSNSMQAKIALYYQKQGYPNQNYKTDILTDYFDMLEKKLHYNQWYCGHYHLDIELDEKHRILYHKIISI